MYIVCFYKGLSTFILFVLSFCTLRVIDKPHRKCVLHSTKVYFWPLGLLSGLTSSIKSINAKATAASIAGNARGTMHGSCLPLTASLAFSFAPIDMVSCSIMVSAPFQDGVSIPGFPRITHKSRSPCRLRLSVVIPDLPGFLPAEDPAGRDRGSGCGYNAARRQNRSRPRCARR